MFASDKEARAVQDSTPAHHPAEALSVQPVFQAKVEQPGYVPCHGAWCSWGGRHRGLRGQFRDGHGSWAGLGHAVLRCTSRGVCMMCFPMCIHVCVQGLNLAPFLSRTSVPQGPADLTAWQFLGGKLAPASAPASHAGAGAGAGAEGAGAAAAGAVVRSPLSVQHSTALVMWLSAVGSMCSTVGLSLVSFFVIAATCSRPWVPRSATSRGCR